MGPSSGGLLRVPVHGATAAGATVTAATATAAGATVTAAATAFGVAVTAATYAADPEHLQGGSPKGKCRHFIQYVVPRPASGHGRE